VSPVLLGLDAGGGSVRALLLDTERGPLAIARRRWSHPAAPDTGGLGVDLDLDLSWRLLCEATREVLARAIEPFPIPVRTLDAIHLASLEFLRGQRVEIALASYDTRMLEAANRLGIPVFSL